MSGGPVFDINGVVYGMYVGAIGSNSIAISVEELNEALKNII